nr:MAG TPA: hypothetical protein [Caudoviricetes sp.]
MKFQGFQAILPTLFVHPVSFLKKDITAAAVEFSTTTAVFTNSFCPITLTFGIYGFWVNIKLRQWKTMHTHFVL